MSRHNSGIVDEKAPTAQLTGKQKSEHGMNWQGGLGRQIVRGLMGSRCTIPFIAKYIFMPSISPHCRVIAMLSSVELVAPVDQRICVTP